MTPMGGVRKAEMANVYEHVTPEMKRRVLTVLEERWLRSVATLTHGERDRPFAMAPLLEEHYRGDKENGLPEEPASKMISQISPSLV